jgi:hypothetical protein
VAQDNRRVFHAGKIHEVVKFNDGCGVAKYGTGYRCLPRQAAPDIQLPGVLAFGAVRGGDGRMNATPCEAGKSPMSRQGYPEDA